MSISLSDIQNALRTAVSRRSRVYSKSFALAIRFEKDDTRAERDCKHFQHILHAFGLSPAEEYVIEGSDNMPGWRLITKFRSFLDAAIQSPGRSIVLVHYAGHGKIDRNGDLVFQANFKSHQRSFRFRNTFLDIVSENSPFSESNPSVDVVFILDSCYSGRATRAATNVSRVVEVLAAVKAEETAFSHHTTAS